MEHVHLNSFQKDIGNCELIFAAVRSEEKFHPFMYLLLCHFLDSPFLT